MAKSKPSKKKTSKKKTSKKKTSKKKIIKDFKSGLEYSNYIHSQMKGK